MFVNVAQCSEHCVGLQTSSDDLWVFDVTRRAVLCTLRSSFRGGELLQLTSDLSLCIAGNFRQGVACHDVRSGREIWRREDLALVNFLRLERDSNELFCTFYDRDCHVLDPQTGRSLRTEPDIHDVRFSPLEPFAVVEPQTRPEDTSPPAWQLRMRDIHTQIGLLAGSNRALDLAFGYGRVLVSQMGGSVLCFDTTEVRRIWAYAPPPGCHVTTLFFDDEADEVSGVEIDVNSGDCWLNRIRVVDGACRRLGPLEERDWVSVNHGSYLVSRTGVVIDAADGRVREQLAC